MIDVSSDAPIFIVGCPRSGTTLLQDLLRSHPHLTFPGESHFIPAFYRSYGDPRNAAEARRLAARILKLRWIRRWKSGLEPESFSDCRSFREILTRMYETWARQENKPRWGDKTPQHVAEIPLLLTLFPGARIIHIYRDGRDVALSWIRFRRLPHNVYTAAKLWRRYVSSGRRAGAALSRETYMEVCYEGLLQQPRETMQRVCEFIGEPFDEAVLRPSPRIRDQPLNPLVGRRSFPEILSGNFGKWKTQMPVKDRVVFESVAGDLLETLGYETEGHTRRISMVERLAWNLHQRFWWTQVRIPFLHRKTFFSSFLRLTWAKARAQFGRAPL